MSVAPDGTNALNMAVVNAYFEMASALLDAGADPNMPDPRGSTHLPYDCLAAEAREPDGARRKASGHNYAARPLRRPSAA